MRRLLPLLGMLSVLAGLTALFVLGREPTSQRHAADRAGLRELAHLDVLIQTEVLSTSSGRTGSYDRLDQLVASLQAGHQLLRARWSGHGFAAADRALAEQLELVDGFKRHNAVLRSSMLYIPRALAEVHDLVAGAPAADRALFELSEAVMRLGTSARHGEQGDAGLRAPLAQLAQLEVARALPSLDALDRHLAVVERERAAVEGGLKRLEEIERLGLYDALSRELEAAHLAYLAKARTSRRWLFAATLALVVLVIGVLARHRAWRRQVDDQLRESRRLIAASERELEIASRIQTSLVPTGVVVEGLELAASMVPATTVGGDYYDVVAVEDGCWIAIGDVTGHGLNAGLIMLMVQSALAALLRHDPEASPRSLVRRLNQVMFDNIRRRLGVKDLVTFSLVRYRTDGSLVYAGAHEDIIICRARDGACVRLETPGTWLGGMPDVDRFTIDSHALLEVGDLVLLYTDGITEAMDPAGVQFGIDRLCDALSAERHLPPAAIERGLSARVADWSCARADDMTLVDFRFDGVQAARVAA